MIKCPNCDVYSATFRAKIEMCPLCHKLLDHRELLELLKDLGLSENLIESVRREIIAKEVVKELPSLK